MQKKAYISVLFGGVLDSILKYAGYAFFVFAGWTIAGTQTALVIGLAVAVVAIVFRGTGELRTKMLLPFILLYYGAYFLSNLLCGDFSSSMQSLSNEWLPLTVLFWGALNWEERQFQRGIDILVAIASIFAVCAIVQHFVGWNFLRNEPLEPMGKFYIATGAFDEHLTFAAVYFLIGFFIFGYLLSGGGKTVWRKRMYWLSFTLCVFAVIFAYARSIWIVMVITVLLGAGLKGKKELAWATSTIVAIVAVLFIVFPDITKRVQTLFNPAFGSNLNRIILWKTALRMIYNSPIVGLGCGGFTRRFNQFFVGGFCPVRCHPHNDYLNILVEIGAFGLLIYLGMFATFFVMTVSVIKHHRGFWRNVSAGAAIAIFGIMLAGLFESFFVNDEVQEIIIFMLSLGAIAWTKRVKSDEIISSKSTEPDKVNLMK